MTIIPPRVIVAEGDRPEGPPTLCESPRYLRGLADWFDAVDDQRNYPIEYRYVQRDLRFWAEEIERLCHA